MIWMFDKYVISSSSYIYPQILKIMHLEIKYTYNMDIFLSVKHMPIKAKNTTWLLCENVSGNDGYFH